MVPDSMSKMCCPSNGGRTVECLLQERGCPNELRALRVFGAADNYVSYHPAGFALMRWCVLHALCQRLVGRIPRLVSQARTW
jgi:hypothetical protein